MCAGSLVLAGGVAGYAKAGSVPSLIAGVCIGSTLIGAGYTVSQGKDFEGHAMGAASGWILTAAMGQRFLSSGKFMPAGLAAGVGLLTALYNSKKAKDWSD